LLVERRCPVPVRDLPRGVQELLEFHPIVDRGGNPFANMPVPSSTVKPPGVATAGDILSDSE
jgi:hypothetical protein